MMVDWSALLQKNPVNNPWCRKVVNEVNVETPLLDPSEPRQTKIKAKLNPVRYEFRSLQQISNG